MSAYRRAVDLLEHSGKRAAKAVYRRPVIEIARLWRRALRSTCCIGITGSAGKTTAKELVYATLAECARTVKSDDSNNQLYSIARTLIATPPATRYVVQEVGASKPGGFEPMLSLLKPRVGVVTNIGIDHYKAFRNRERVAAEKRKLIDALPADGIAVLNADDERVAGMAAGCRGRVLTYGTTSTAELRATGVRSAWPEPLSLRVEWRGEAVDVRTRLHGRHQYVPVLASIAAACALGISLPQACAAVSRVDAMRGRMSVYRTDGGIEFVRDDWKSPVWSVPLSLDFLNDADANRKFVLLGTLSDYGGTSRKVYRKVVEHALRVADHVIVVGDRGAKIEERIASSPPGRLHGFADIGTAAGWLREFLQAGDLVLMKGSNGADHLSRLPLAFDQPVGCWRRRCGRDQFCDTCRLLQERAHG